MQDPGKMGTLYEATQIKGDGETHPFLSPNDEFANYETWDQGNLDLSVLKEQDMLQYEYARSALQIGLQLEKELGVNPYKFRNDRIHRQPHGACHGRRGQLLRQALGRGTRAEALGAPHGPDR